MLESLARVWVAIRGDGVVRGVEEDAVDLVRELGWERRSDRLKRPGESIGEHKLDHYSRVAAGDLGRRARTRWGASWSWGGLW